MKRVSTVFGIYVSWVNKHNINESNRSLGSGDLLRPLDLMSQ
jgi:hypothetical protein